MVDSRDSDDSLLIEQDSRIEVLDKPIHEKLHWKSPEHGRLLSELQSMIRASKAHIDQRKDDWDQVDKYMRLYLDFDAPKRYADKTYDTAGKKSMPYKGAICMPVMYTMVMTRAGHKYAQLTATEPRIHYEPTESNDFIGSRVHEVIARYDLRQSRFDLKMWQAIMDQERYGLSVWYDTFEEKFGYQAQRGMSPLEAMLMGVDLDEPIWTRTREWNNIGTVDPRNVLLDPNVPIADPQVMNYIGHTDYTNILWYLERALKDGNGAFFNLKQMRKLANEQSTTFNEEGRWMDGSYSNSGTRKYPNPPVDHLQWKIIPKEWGLAPRDKPEIWWFSVYDESLIIRAHKSVYAHGEFTYCISVADPDLHAPFTPGMAQQMIGGQDASDWYVNSHMINSKKIVNDMVIFNDDLINPVDMASPEPAKHIRLTRRGKRMQEMGQMRIQDMYAQFMITDVTQQHLNTFHMLFQMLQRMSSTPDTMQGMQLPSKRTLGEVETVNESATLRLGVEAQLQDLMLVEPYARRLISNRQQFSTMKKTYRLVGRLIEQLGGPGKAQMFEISPDDLEGEYDYIPHTTTMAPDPARMTAIWGQLLTMLAQAPQLMNPDSQGMVLNPIAVFDEFVRSAGINYLDQFKVKVEPQPGMPLPGQLPPEAQTGASQPGINVQSEEQIDKKVQSGNMIPIG
jgi:hypothetical protein